MKDFISRYAKNPNEENILDVPCGEGRFIPIIKNQGFNEMWHHDISDQMMLLARSAHPDRSHNITKADITDLPHSDNYFDHTICARLLHMCTLQEIEGILHELRRVTTTAILVNFFLRTEYTPTNLIDNATRLIKRKKRKITQEHAEQKVLHIIEKLGLVVDDKVIVDEGRDKPQRLNTFLF